MDGNDPQQSEVPSGSWQFKPGDTVQATTQQAAAPVAQVPPAEAAVSVSPQANASTPQATVAADAPVGAQPVVTAAPADTSLSPASSENFASQQEPAKPATTEVTWTASEYIAHGKGIDWYVLLAAGAFILAAIVYFLTKDLISTAIMPVVAILFGVSAGRKPRVLTYHVVPQGITVGARFYSFADFKSFSVLDEGAVTSIIFMPMRRFMPPLNVYFEPDDEEKIVDVISAQLPFLPYTGDPIDNFLRRIRF